MKIIYNNLGARSGNRMIYIRSTDIECKNWKFLLMSFPDEALYFMTLGYDIEIHDNSSNASGKIERIFCPAFSDFLRVLRQEPCENKNVKAHTEYAYEAYKKNKDIKRKYDFFKNKLKSTTVRGVTHVFTKEPSVWV